MLYLGTLRHLRVDNIMTNPTQTRGIASTGVPAAASRQSWRYDMFITVSDMTVRYAEYVRTINFPILFVDIAATILRFLRGGSTTAYPREDPNRLAPSVPEGRERNFYGCSCFLQ